MLCYVYVYVLSLRRAIATAYVAGEISSMASDDQRFDDRGRSYTAEIREFHTIRVPFRTIITQDRNDDFLPVH